MAGHDGRLEFDAAQRKNTATAVDRGRPLPERGARRLAWGASGEHCPAELGDPGVERARLGAAGLADEGAAPPALVAGALGAAGRDQPGRDGARPRAAGPSRMAESWVCPLVRIHAAEAGATRAARHRDFRLHAAPAA